MKIITISGSTKFKKELIETNRRLTAEGNIVLMCPFFDHSEGDNATEEFKTAMTELHKQRILKSDMLYVVNVDGYIGESVREEIAFAKENNIPIQYLEPIPDGVS